MADEAGPVEIPDEEAAWDLVVFPELGAHARTIAHYAGPVDDELIRSGLGYVHSFGTYKNRTQHSIDVKVRDAAEGLATIRRLLRALNAPPPTVIRGGGREDPIDEGATQ